MTDLKMNSDQRDLLSTSPSYDLEEVTASPWLLEGRNMPVGDAPGPTEGKPWTGDPTVPPTLPVTRPHSPPGSPRCQPAPEPAQHGHFSLRRRIQGHCGFQNSQPGIKEHPQEQGATRRMWGDPLMRALLIPCDRGFPSGRLPSRRPRGSVEDRGGGQSRQPAPGAHSPQRLPPLPPANTPELQQPCTPSPAPQEAPRPPHPRQTRTRHPAAPHSAPALPRAPGRGR